MKRIVLGVLVASSVLWACGVGPFGPCPQVDCANATSLTVVDGSGNAVNDFSGSAEFGGEHFLIGCGTESAPDAGSTLPDGGQAYFGTALCDGNRVTMYGGGFGTTVHVDLKSGARKYNGVLDVTQKPNTGGSGACTYNCPSQEGTVTVQ